MKRARDGYGNETTMLYVDGPIEAIAITVSGEVLTEDRAGVIGGAPEPLPAAAFLQPTALTTPDVAIRDFVTELSLPTDPLAGAHVLAEALHDLLVLDPAEPNEDHRAAAAFALRKADAQGAAHLLIAAARVAGYPARYVAGHLFRPYEHEMHAAHGWAELYVPDYGWIGFDPYEGRCPKPMSGSRSGWTITRQLRCRVPASVAEVRHWPCRFWSEPNRPRGPRPTR
jgi:transglutaminase-like putative cysteine protease